MPELPEVQTIVNELNRKLRNKTIRSIKVGAPKMVALGPNTVSNIRAVKSHQVIEFIKLLQGQKIIKVSRRAKLLIFDLSGPLSILAHLKMTGQFIFEDKKLRQKTGGYYNIINKLDAPKVRLPCKHTHIIFNFSDGSILYFNDVRKFGYLKLVRDDELDQVKELKEYSPEPLSKEFTLNYFKLALKKRNRTTIKQALMDPKVAAGIGNIYSDEILFHAKVRPTRLVASIKEQELRGIYRYIRIVLKRAIKAKGSSVGDFIRTDGSWGSMGKHHFVYGRKGQKCKKCGTIVSSVKITSRTASFCPKCQK